MHPQINAIYTDLNVFPALKIILQYFLPEYQSLSQSSQNTGLQKPLPVLSGAIHRFLPIHHPEALVHSYSRNVIPPHQ